MDENVEFWHIWSGSNLEYWKSSSNKHGLGYNLSEHENKQKNLTIFVPTKAKRDPVECSAKSGKNDFILQNSKI